MLISIIPLLCYHFRRDAIQESLTWKPEAINIDTGKIDGEKVKALAWLKSKQVNVKTTNKPAYQKPSEQINHNQERAFIIHMSKD